MMPLWAKSFMWNKEKVMTPKKVNVSINPETMELLKAEKARLTQDLGFVPSFSQVIQYLVKPKQIDNRVEMLNKGV
jgi:hypothetical protein